ncbi:MAG: YaiO family outer membrane beta-barrel protein [Croceitalea sp.]|nr:YaiO family outer membrane beta-barrel protein [Croceitalea sp.]
MKKIRYILFLLVFPFWGQINAYAQEVKDPDISFMNARAIAFEGSRTVARDSLKRILFAYPSYADAALLIAKTHSWDKNYDEARKHFNRITSVDKLKKEVWIAAINNEIRAKNLNIALGLANKSLVHLQFDEELQSLKGQIMKKLNKGRKRMSKYKRKERKYARKRSIMVGSAIESFDKVYDPMYAATVQFETKSEFGKIIPRVNYAERFKSKGMQYELDTYPVISKKLYAYTNFAFSDSKIFPKQKGGLELFAELPKALEVSGGVRYMRFADQSASIVTGSLGIYRGNYYASLRPFATTTSNGNTVFSGTLMGRKYLRDPSNYFGVQLTYGFDSEINQFIVDGELLSETTLFLDTQRIRFEYQFSDKSSDHLFKTHLGVNRQELAFDAGNYVFSITAGIQYQINL